MIRSFKELIEKVQNGEPQTLSVAVAQDADVLLSVWNAYQNRIIQGAYLQSVLSHSPYHEPDIALPNGTVPYIYQYSDLKHRH